MTKRSGGSYGDADGRSRVGGRGAPTRGRRVDDFRFVRVELTTAEKTGFREQLAAGEYDGGGLDLLLREGLKVSFSLQDGGKTCLCSLSSRADDAGAAGLVLTSRAGDSATALALACYKHFVICAGESWEAAEQLRGGRYDDID